MCHVKAKFFGNFKTFFLPLESNISLDLYCVKYKAWAFSRIQSLDAFIASGVLFLYIHLITPNSSASRQVWALVRYINGVFDIGIDNP